MEDYYVNNEEKNYDHRIQDLISANQVVEYVVGRSVASSEEHIVIIEDSIRAESRDAEGEEYRKGDRYIFLLHACHSRDRYVERCKSRYAVRYSRYHVVKGENGIASVVLSRAVCAEQI